MRPSSKDIISSKVSSSYSSRKRKYFIHNEKREKTELQNYPQFLETFGSLIYGEYFYLVDSQKSLSSLICTLCQKALKTSDDESSIYTIFFSHEIAGRPILFNLKIGRNNIGIEFFRERRSNTYSVEESFIYAEVFKYFPSKKILISTTNYEPISSLENKDISLLINCTSLKISAEEIDDTGRKALTEALERKKIESVEQHQTLIRAKLLEDAPITHKFYELGSAIFSNSCKLQDQIHVSTSDISHRNESIRLIGYLGFLIGGLMIYPMEYTGIMCGFALSIFSPLFVGRKGFSMIFNATTAIAFAFNWQAASLFSAALITVGGEDFLEFYANNVISPVEEFFRGTEPDISIKTI